MNPSNQKTTSAANSAILIIVIGILLLLIAYFVYNDRSRNNADQIASPLGGVFQATSTAGEAASTEAAVPSEGRDQAEPAVISRAENMQKSVSAFASILKPKEPAGRLCTANDLSGMAEWGNSGAYLSGSLRVKNSSTSDCVLSKDSRISIYTGNRLIADRQTSGPSTGMLIPRGGEKLVRFTWSNWCGGSLSNPSSIVFALPDEAGYLKVPFISSDGDPQYDVPRCGSANGNTSLDMWW